MEIKDFFPNGLHLNDAFTLLEPVALYILGMSIYTLFVFKFYRFLASKDIFTFDLSRYEASRHRAVRVVVDTAFYIAKYLFIFPVVAFFWFAAFTVLLSFLAPDRPFSDILLVALAVVGTIRISAYLTEELSRDLAKILPFAVLGIFIVNVSFFKTSESFEVLRQANAHRESILYFLMGLIVLEFALRISSAFAADIKNVIVRHSRSAVPTTSPIEAHRE